MNYLRRSWAAIDLDALGENVRNIRGKLKPGVKMMAIVKADAYGHGAKNTARLLSEAGVEWFAVSNINEALCLRAYGIKEPILILGLTPPSFARTLAEHKITQAVYSLEFGRELQREAAEQGVTVEYHCKIDTGMGRLGFNGFENLRAIEEIIEIDNFPNLRRTGTFTHFAVADEGDEGKVGYTREQYKRFTEICAQMEERGLATGLKHCSNSAATICYPEMQMDAVRPGIILYGMHPAECTKGKIELKPVLSLHSVVSMVKEVEAGRAISYGCIYHTEGKRRIATVPIGYADGYTRLLSNKGKMLINGKIAPITGRVCMDQVMVDVTGIEGVDMSSPVTIIGKQGDLELTASDWGEAIGTVNYEVTCLLSKRIPRVYIRGGREVDMLDTDMTIAASMVKG